MKTLNTLPRLLFALLPLTPLTLAGCGNSHSETRPFVAPVLVMTVNTASDASAGQRRLPGFIMSRYQADIGFQVPGRVVERLVEVGAKVTKGQALLRLQSTDYVQGLSAAEDQLQAARIDAQQSATDAKRFASLVKSGAVSEADQLGQQARADAAQARLNLAERQAVIARNRLAYTTLTAPFDGVVTSLRAEVGQVVSEGLPVIQIARNDTPELVVDVPEDMIGSIPKGNLGARLTGIQNRLLTVRLREMEPSASLPLRAYRARFSVLDNSQSMLQDGKLGMSAELIIPAKASTQGKDGFALPASAIMGQGNITSVWVVDTQSSALVKKGVTVTQLLDQGVKVSGLQDGEKVVITGTEKLREGQSVRAIERTGTAFEPGTQKSGEQAASSASPSKTGAVQ